MLNQCTCTIYNVHTFKGEDTDDSHVEKVNFLFKLSDIVFVITLKVINLNNYEWNVRRRKKNNNNKLI